MFTQKQIIYGTSRDTILFFGIRKAMSITVTANRLNILTISKALNVFQAIKYAYMHMKISNISCENEAMWKAQVSI